MKKFSIALATLLFSSLAFAEGATAAAGGDVGRGLIAVGMGLAIGLGAVGAGLAQGRIGAAAAGAIAEDGSKFGQMLILVVLPETLVIFGFLIAILLQGKLG